MILINLTYRRCTSCSKPTNGAPASSERCPGGLMRQRLIDQNSTMGVMKTEPQPSDKEVLAGLVERVTYLNAEDASASSGEGAVTATSARWSATRP
jgi:hypothetical protein